jgi:hypothetical protein
MTATETALKEASAGLTYESESDAPWAVVYWPAASGEVTGEGVRKLDKHKPSAKIEEIPADAFFASLAADKDWYGDEEKAIAERYRALGATIQSTLTNPKVVRVAAGTKVTIYAVGQAKEGGWAGLRTEAVET